MIKKLLIILVFALVTSVCSAKDLYVSTTGNDSVTYANNDIANPWLTPLKAWTEADAGDTVYFRFGTYSITSAITTKFIGNNGTAGNPITFTSYTDEQAVFSTTLTSPVFNLQKNYNTIDNIDFTGAAATWFSLAEDLDALHFEIRNCNAVLAKSVDNNGFVKTTGRSDYCVIENNTIEGGGTMASGNGMDVGCLWIGGTDYLTIKNNVLFNASIGIYFKTDNDENSGNEIAYNYIYNCDRNSIQTNSIYTNFHDNLIGSGCGSFQVNEDNGFSAGDNNTINHNTIYSGSIYLNADLLGADNNTMTNNISAERFACCDGNVWDYNMYVSGAAIGANDLGNTSPTYAGGSTPSTIAGYTLTTESNGYLAGSDSKDMGADISLVGVDADEDQSSEIGPGDSSKFTSGDSTVIN